MTALSDIRSQVQARLDELRPLLAEAEQLQSVLAAIDALPGPEVIESEAGAPRTLPPMRLPVEVRRQQVLALLIEQGEMRVGEVANGLDVSHARAVQLVNGLEADGLVRRSTAGVEITDEGAKQGFGIKLRVRGFMEVGQ